MNLYRTPALLEATKFPEILGDPRLQIPNIDLFFSILAKRNRVFPTNEGVNNILRNEGMFDRKKERNKKEKKKKNTSFIKQKSSRKSRKSPGKRILQMIYETRMQMLPAR